MLSSAGREMVYVFFVLSGFFISLSLSNNKYSIHKFLSIRLLRVYIPFLFSIIISFVIFLIAVHFSPSIFNQEYFLNQELLLAKENLNLTTFGKTLLLIKHNKVFFANNFVYWSLTYEVLFYLIICLFKSEKGRLYFTYLGLIFFLLSYFININFILGPIDTRYILFFSSGVGFHLLYKKYYNSLIKIKLHSFVSLILSLSLFAIVLYFVKVNPINSLAQIFSILLTFQLMLFFGLSKANKNSLLNMFLNFLGKISYTLYLVHIPILLLVYAIISVLKNEIIWYTRSEYYLTALICIPISYGIYLISEKPSMKIIAWVKQRSN